MYQIFLNQIVFQSSDRVELDFCEFAIKIAFNFRYRETKKIELSYQGTYNFQLLGIKTLITADCEYTKIFRFTLLDIKLWLKDENILHQF